MQRRQMTGVAMGKFEVLAGKNGNPGELVEFCARPLLGAGGVGIRIREGGIGRYLFSDPLPARRLFRVNVQQVGGGDQ